jgi:hypothetical protein
VGSGDDFQDDISTIKNVKCWILEARVILNFEPEGSEGCEMDVKGVMKLIKLCGSPKW